MPAKGLGLLWQQAVYATEKEGSAELTSAMSSLQQEINQLDKVILFHKTICYGGPRVPGHIVDEVSGGQHFTFTESKPILDGAQRQRAQIVKLMNSIRGAQSFATRVASNPAELDYAKGQAKLEERYSGWELECPGGTTLKNVAGPESGVRAVCMRRDGSSFSPGRKTFDPEEGLSGPANARYLLWMGMASLAAYARPEAAMFGLAMALTKTFITNEDAGAEFERVQNALADSKSINTIQRIVIAAVVTDYMFGWGKKLLRYTKRGK